jgi:uncharacterized protein
MPPTSGLNAFLKGYLLLFDWREAPAYSAATGGALLVVFVVLEYLVGPRTHILDWLGLAQPPAWGRIVALSTIAVLGTLLVGAKLRAVGLPPFSAWTSVEALFLVQVVVIASAVFVALNIAALRVQTGWQLIAGAAVTEIMWGFYQELIYRGILQTELVRRFGAVAGIVVANTAFVFGPLHFYLLIGQTSVQSKEVLFAATFATGLIFAYIVLRTRNVILVGLMHGIGDAVANVPHVFHATS